MKLRIIGGELGGRLLEGPKTAETRPTSDRVREAVASALSSRGAFEHAHVIDLFCGTGALAFEALSRGALDAVLVDRSKAVCKLAQTNAATLGLEHRVRVFESDLERASSSTVEKLGTFNLVFADPPHALSHVLMPIIAKVAATDAWVVLEYSTKSEPPGLEETLTSVSRYRYGDTSIAIGARR